MRLPDNAGRLKFRLRICRPPAKVQLPGKLTHQKRDDPDSAAEDRQEKAYSFQIFSAYSRTARSAEKMPDFAMFTRDISVNFVRSV